MHPVIAPKRVYIPGGMWTPKLGGDFVEGNPLNTKHIVEGHADIKEMDGRLKLFFKDVKIKQRKIVLLSKDKDAIREEYEARKAEKRAEKRKLTGLDPDEESDEEEMSAEEKHSRKEAIKYDLDVLYLNAEKKIIPQPNLTLFMTLKKPKVKMTNVHKVGSKIYLSSAKTGGLFGVSGTTGVFEASLKDIPDAIAYGGIVVVKLPTDEPKTEDSVIYGFIKLVSSRSSKTKTGTALHLSSINDQLQQLINSQDSSSKTKNVQEMMRPLGLYRDLASKAWLSFNIEPDGDVGIDILLQMLLFTDTFLVDAQAVRLFEACIVRKNGRVGILELENILMAYDVMGQAGIDILPRDLYDSFYIKPNIEEFGEFAKGSGLDFSSFYEVCQMLGMKKISIDEDKDDVMAQAFMFGSGCKIQDINTTYMTLDQMKRGWLKVCDMEAEMGIRKMKYDSGNMAQGRNRDRLYRVIDDQEQSYLMNLSKINSIVEDVKKLRRQKKDDLKRERAGHIAGIQQEATKFIAARGQEKRLQAKQEAEAKTQKRLEEKQMRLKLLQRQEEARDAKANENKEARLASMKLRADEISKAGLDRCNMSVQNLRKIPSELYDNDAAQTKLTYLVTVDFSKNIIDELPIDNFFYWMSDVKKFKISQNRLKILPENFTRMVHLQILELDTNKLNAIPQDIGILTNLQRLDISNNNISDIPDSIGMLGSLRFFYAHSNNVVFLPPNIGGCFRLEYFDMARNKLKELPNNMEHLASLTYLDVASNRLGQLPNNLGLCSKLNYLDVSNNSLTSIPETFSLLSALELCNMENNDIVLKPNSFNGLNILKKLNLRRNQAKHIYLDIGKCVGLTLLDFSVNRIQFIPPEIGLLISLQECDISRNNLTTIPPEFGSCRLLQRLDLPYNDIEGMFPETLGLIASLRFLDCSHNKITGFPESVIGLKNIVTMKAENCHIDHLPNSLSYLHTLENLQLRNNRITIFPIHISCLKSLKLIDLANNSIQLLPRNMDSMTNLVSLDLSKNLLKAVPCEFSEVFESVPNIELSDNPWDMLPPHWGKLWPGKSSVEGKCGYNVAEALSFLFSNKVFYKTAEDIWNEVGVFHYTNRLTYHDFISDLRKRLVHGWTDGLIPHITHVYFTAKQTGVFPRWYSITKDQKKEEVDLKAADRERREYNVQMTRKAVEERNIRVTNAYDVDIKRRAKLVSKLKDESVPLQKTLDNNASIALYHSVVERAKQEKIRLQKRHKRHAAEDKNEINRLQDILRADAAATKVINAMKLEKGIDDDDEDPLLFLKDTKK